MENRWVGLLPASAPEEEDAPAAEVEADDVLVGVPAPQLGIDAPEDRVLGRVVSDGLGVHWVGAHGGSGESTVATLVGGRACDHRWPEMSAGADASVPVVLVARRNHHGMRAASLAAREWASGAHPDVMLLGLVLIEDAPGRIPRELQRQSKVLSGAVPRTWIVPWIEDLRVHGEAVLEVLPHTAAKPLTSLREVVEEHSPARERNV